MYYSAFGILSLILYLIINFRILLTKNEDQRPASMISYRYFLFSVILYLLTDIAWGFLYEQHLITAVFADTVVYFLAMALSVFLWSRYVVAYLDITTLFSKLVRYAGWIMFAIVVVCSTINLFSPIIFMFDGEGKYVPLQVRYFFLSAQILLFASTAIYTFVVSLGAAGKDKYHYLTVSISGIVMAVFIFLQTSFPLLPFYAVGCILSTTLIHCFVTEDERMDFVDKLGNAKQSEKELKGKLELQEKLYEQEMEKHRADAMITALATEYRSVFYVDLDKDEAVCYRLDHRLHNEVEEGGLFPFHIMFYMYAGKNIVEEDRENFTKFIDFDNLCRELADKRSVAIRYRSIITGQKEYEMLRVSKIDLADENKDGKIHAVCAGFVEVE